MELFKNYLKSLKPIYRAVGSFFIGCGGRGGAWLSKNVDNQGWPMTKNTLKLPPKKWKFRPKYIWFKISYLEFFFWKYYFGHTKFFFNFRFSSRKFQSQQKLAKMITFYNTVLLKKPHLFYEHQITWHEK